VPEELERLPSELRSHSADHCDFGRFKGREVAVIGGGQSGLETAAILHEEGAAVSLVVRAPQLIWGYLPPTKRRSAYQRWRRPRTRLGDGLQLLLYDRAPLLFHYLPQQFRLSRVKTALGPAGAWWLKDRVVGKFPAFLDHQIRSAGTRRDRVALELAGPDGRIRDLTADHVIAATGYRFDLRKLPFLDDALKSRLQYEEQVPRLSVNFESSIPGLYFTSLASAYSFGPVMRFLAGTGFTARRISAHVARTQRQVAAARFAPLQTCLER
jgi:FAD-dependent urate hydroxylase